MQASDDVHAARIVVFGRFQANFQGLARISDSSLRITTLMLQTADNEQNELEKTMPKKRRKDSYRIADIIIATILGAMLGLIVNSVTDKLREPIFFHGELILAFTLVGGILGIIGGKLSTDFLDDTLQQLREFLDWRRP